MQLPKLTAPSDTPLYVQIADDLREQIQSGGLAPKTRLPASRSLAADLGLSRTTCVAAYDQLIAEGYLETRRGAGVFVGDIALLQSPPSLPLTTSLPGPSKPTLLSAGTPDPRIFPVRAWARVIAQVGREDPHALSERQDAFGDPILRREIAAYVARWRGIHAHPDQIIVTSGAREALELAMEALIAGEDIALETPGFSPTYRYAQRRGWNISALQVGTRGAQLPHQMAKVTVLTPSHQFPLGGALPVAPRLAFLQAAQARDGWIIEDDFDSEFRYTGQPLPAMAALDKGGRCLYIGTFSKTFSHALRLGYLILPPALVPPFRTQFAHPSSGAAITAQRPLAQFMASGQYDRHIRRARRIYGERYDIASTCLSKWPARLGHFARHRAGMQIAYHLDGQLSDKTLCAHAAQAGFDLTPMSSHAGPAKANGLLIGFCATDAKDLPDQFSQLQQIVQYS